MSFIHIVFGSLTLILAFFLIVFSPAVLRIFWAKNLLKHRTQPGMAQSVVKKERVGFWGWCGAFCLVQGLLWNSGFWSLALLLVWVLGTRISAQLALHRLQNAILREFLSFLYALPGLLEVGISFTQALEILRPQKEGTLQTLLDWGIHHFKRGAPLNATFVRLKAKIPEPLVSRSLQIFEMAQRKGIALQPLVRNSIESLEAEVQVREKLAQLRKSLLFQVALAFCTPWILGAATAWFQPELVEFWKSQKQSALVVWGAFLWEGMGLWILYHQTRFY
ncbi:hypothetical protein EBR03_06605 [bacterium]|nr:hypothetical protein [bacterium]